MRRLIQITLVGLVLGSISSSLAAQTMPAQKPHYIDASLEIPSSEGQRELYPVTAKMALAEAVGTVDCEVQPDGTLTDCHGTYSDPQAYGFSEASAKLFEKFSHIDMSHLATPLQPHDRVSQAFEWHLFALMAPQSPPIYFKTDPVAADARLNHAKWTYPGSDQLAIMYPRKAAQERIGGKVTIECFAGAGGEMQYCHVLSEAPLGYGFGEATADMFLRYGSVDPASAQGAQVQGLRKHFTYSWAMQ